MKKILVTGGAGFIGSHLVDRLVEKGHKVLVIDDLSGSKLDNINAKADFEQIDITSKEIKSLVKKFRPNAIFHLAAQSSISKSIKNPKKDIAINLLATQDLLDGAKETKVNKIVFASSAAIYAESRNLPITEDATKEPISLYGVCKLCSEYLMRSNYKMYGIPYVSLRFANVYGPRQNKGAEGGVVAIFINRILKNEKIIIFGKGTQTRDFVYISDVVDAAILAIRDEIVGEFNIGTARETSIINLYEKLLKLSSAQENKKFAKHIFLEVKRNSLSFKKFKNICGWQPKLNLDQGLKLTFDYFQKIR